MTELKTLKDWMDKWKMDITIDPSLQDLRQEAIKWVKILIKADDYKKYSYMEGFCLEHMKVDGCIGTFGLSWEECSDIPSVTRFIKHFFSITAEDLK